MRHEITLETTVNGIIYSATVDADDTVRIYRGTEYAGQGTWRDGSIQDCAAELVPGNADASESVYDALDQEIAAAL